MERRVGEKHFPLDKMMIGMVMNVSVISYNDISLGVNIGDITSEAYAIEETFGVESKYVDDEHMEDELVLRDKKDEEQVLHADHIFCLDVKLSKPERKKAWKPFRKSVIVKLLGKMVGFRFLRTRLMKL